MSRCTGRQKGKEKQKAWKLNGREFQTAWQVEGNGRRMGREGQTNRMVRGKGRAVGWEARGEGKVDGQKAIVVMRISPLNQCISPQIFPF